ncbi:type III secretion protein RspP [Pseudomonas fluorescens]|uniref:Type III secretion protein RspP n=1 Tax=Pseudomonas fluorescens TaxID=294 RepID=A0A379I8X8_PSEFL|nr:type III secretion system HrpP C-terminal domain-containing protein [Pseudomonas fluorescens]AIG04843.1 hypothetical protein HZ99_22685 [Pseudomonas fluorescens]SUD29167.1 type III secretion protein RspP [Pseudomonas fluorescens]
MTQVSASKPERPRLREPRDDREPVMAWGMAGESGQLFTQLLGDTEEGAGYASSTAGAAVSANILMIEAMTSQLLPHIRGGGQWPLQALLHLPRLGRISASVRREQGTWSIELAAEQEHTARWLGGVRQSCQTKLCEALGQPVDLHLVHVGAA